MDVAGSILVAIGGVCAVAGILLRFGFFMDSREIKTFGWKYYLCAGLSFFGTLPAYVGFSLLIQGPVNANQDYSQVLGVLSLLAAGIITGFFTFTYANVSDDEVALPTFISVCFAVLFYVVFCAISYYTGKSKLTHNVEGVWIFVPLIMWLLLVANMIYDYLDYRKNPGPSPPPQKKEEKK